MSILVEMQQMFDFILKACMIYFKQTLFCETQRDGLHLPGPFS